MGSPARLLAALAVSLAVALPAEAQVPSGGSNIGNNIGGGPPTVTQPHVVSDSGVISSLARSGILAQVKASGGIIWDFNTNDFGYQNPTTGGYTSYADFPTMFAALSGSVTSSDKWTYNSAGTLVKVSANTIAAGYYDYAGNKLGVQWEWVGTQSLLQTEVLTNAAWTKNATTVTASQRTTPSGVALTAPLVKEDSTTAEHSITQSVVKAASALTYTMSCYMAPGAGNRSYLLKATDSAGNGNYAIFSPDYTAGNPAVVTLGTGFTGVSSFNTPGGLDATTGVSPYGYSRVSLTFTTNSDTTIKSTFGLSDGVNVSYAGDNNSSLAIWGCNLVRSVFGGNEEGGLFRTSYIPSTTVAVTRNRDQIKMTLPAPLQSATAYSIMASPVFPFTTVPAALGTIFALSDAAATSTNNIKVIQNSAGNTGNLALQINNGSTNANIQTAAPLLIVNQQMGVAVVAKAGQHWVENGGQAIKTSTSQNFPSIPVTELRIGNLNIGGATTDNGASTTAGALPVMAIMPAQLPTTTMQTLLFGYAAPYNPDNIVLPNYFTQAMLSGLPVGWELFRGGSLTATDVVSPNPAQFPFTVAYSQDLLSQKTSGMTTAKFSVLPWGNRCDLCTLGLGKKANSAGGVEFSRSDGIPARVSFSTYKASRLAFEAQNLYLAGYPAHAGGACPAGDVVGTTVNASGSGTTLTVPVADHTTFIWPNYVLSGTGVPAGTKIVAQLTGTTGKEGTYQTDNPTTIGGPLTVTSNQKYCGYLDPLADASTAFTGTSAGTTTLTVAGATGVAIENGVFLQPTACTTLASPTFITAQLTGTPGGNGTYQTSQATTCAGVSMIAGIDPSATLTYQTAQAAPSTYFLYFNTNAIGPQFWVTIDRVIFHNAQLPGGTYLPYGSHCDCEMADQYPASSNTANMIEVANVMHNASAARYKFAIGIDSLFSSGVNGGYCGIGVVSTVCDMGPMGNVSVIANQIDHFIVPINTPIPKQFTSLNDQMTQNYALFGAGFSHLIWQIHMGGYPPSTTYANAVDFRAFTMSHTIGGINIINSFGTPGGAATRCYNEKLQQVAFGTSTAPIDPLCGL